MSARRIVVLELVAILALSVPARLANAWAGRQGEIITGNPTPTEEQIRSLIARTVENQHRDDHAIEEFERTEHVVTRKAGENSEVLAERTERIFPTGNGTLKMALSEHGSPVSRELYRDELKFTVTALEVAMHPNERYKQDLAKFEKRRRDRDELVETAAKAFHITWAGRETRGYRTFVKFLLDPDPNYKPPTRFAAILEHVHAAVWIDEAPAQFARLEADISTDINFGGGIVGKVYHGGHVMIEQSEAAPGIWLPTFYTYDVDGRKFMFGFSLHERTEATRYRRVGPPAQSIEIIRAELSSRTAGTPVR